MPRFINFNRDVLVAFLLGIAALTSNMFAMSLGNGIDYFPIGNIFLFISAATLGIPGALVSCFVGSSWEILVTQDVFEFIRLSTCCTVLAYCARKYPKVPSFAIALGLWLALFAPISFFASSIGKYSTVINTKALFAKGIVEVILIMVSGVILLNSRAWSLITNSARRVNVSNLLIHVITCLTTLSMFAVTSTLLGSSSFPMELSARNENLGGLMSIFILGITLPALLAWRLGVILTNNFQELFSAGLLTNVTNKSFSGLSSEFWRRKSMPDIQRDALVGNVQQKDEAQVDSPAGKDRKIIASDEGLCALNRNGTVTFMNRRFKKYCEITSNEVLGKNLSALSINPVICKRIMHLLEETFSKGPRVSEVKINQLPQKLKFYEIRTHRYDAFEDSSIINGPDSIIVTVKDISEKRTVQSHQLQSQKLESLGILVEGIAHTFNNSLTTIAGQASFAKRTSDKSQIDKSLNEILKTSFAAGSVVRQLLEFASGRPNQMKEENLIEVLNERWDLLKRISGENYEIKIERSAEEIGVFCDTNLIMQALTNLVLNAKESYPAQSGEIIISIDIEELDEGVTDLHPGMRPGSFARLRVKDKGHGMSMDVLSKAFDPLFTTKAGSGHTGLGLAIVFAIVRAHDGFLTAESQTDKGTSISIYLPIQELTEKQPKKDSQVISRDSGEVINNPELQGNNEKILVVEDEQTVRELVSAMLSTLGYKVEVCADGQEAYDKATKDQFDLMLIDMVIPKIKGLDLIKMIQKENACKHILVMTGYGESIKNSDIKASIIHKPFDIDTLARAIKTSLNKESAKT